MALWGKTDASNKAPKNQVSDISKNANGSALFGNVTPGGFVNNQALGVFGVDATETNVAGGGKVTHAGWVQVRQGTGPVTGIAANAAGGSFGNLAVGAISNGQVNASFSITTNAAGNVATITLIGAGRGFLNSGAVGLVQPANGIYDVTIADGGRNFSVGDGITWSNGQVNATATVASIKANNGAINTVSFTLGGRGFSNTVNTDRATVSTVKKISQVTINAGGTGYANAEVITFSNGGVNAAGTLTTNSLGGITAVTFTACGNNFVNATATVVTIATAAGTAANITPTVAAGSGSNLVPTIAAGSGLTVVVTLGGRAGRVQYETMVAMGSVTSDGSDDALFPDT